MTPDLVDAPLEEAKLDAKVLVESRVAPQAPPALSAGAAGAASVALAGPAKAAVAAGAGGAVGTTREVDVVVGPGHHP